jgi:hypothetical protein
MRDPSIFKEDSLDPLVKKESLVEGLVEDNDAPSLRAGRIYSWIRFVPHWETFGQN